MIETPVPGLAEINPLFGQLGHLFVILAFVAALLSTVGYCLSLRAQNTLDEHKWKKIARFSFFIHAFSIGGVVITLFLIIFNHHFEYHYAWSHSSLDLQAKYILSCFWEGQEGSFLLWSFWHVVLGLVIQFTAKKWEAPVMVSIALIQVFLVSFILGIYIGDTKIGLSPFLLLKDALTQDPVFLFDNYMSFIQDGTGLNALLQNYWMVIHPPVLFLGFAACSVPFAFAIAGLLKKDYLGWIKPALPFTLFAAMILGVGVLMGGAWAYEALSFGGFWAWDPVENASIMPWLVIVAALHTMVVTKSTGHALKSTFVLIILAFIFVLYASFLTRSGILGDTSVHSFVTSGLMGHLLIFLFTFAGISVFLYLKNRKKFPSIAVEEATTSREFWMFVGSLVLLFSSIHIVFFTSIPVYNQIFGSINTLLNTSLKNDFAAPTDPIHYYTNVQIWVGILIALLSAFTQFLKYKKTNTLQFIKQISPIICIALGLAIASALALNFIVFSIFTLLLFVGYFSVLGNLQYLFQALKGKLKVGGASVAHIGFAVLLIGILISNANQQVISKNTLGIDYGDGFDNDFKRDNILLYKNMPVTMGDFIVTYTGDSTSLRETIYKVRYEKVHPETGEIVQDFTLHPYLLLDKKSEQLTPNPDTKHYLNYDVFTHISSIPKEEPNKQKYAFEQDTILTGDTIYFSVGYMVLKEIKSYPPQQDTITAAAIFDAVYNGKTEPIEAKIQIIQNQIVPIPVALSTYDLELQFTSILPETNQLVFAKREENTKDDWVIMKAIVFPMINLVWAGTIIMAIGFCMSLVRRQKEYKKNVSNKI